MNPFYTAKERLFDTPIFRSYVVSVGCLIDDPFCTPGVIHPHHFTYASEGVASCDLDALGLCSFHHSIAHKLGRDGFADRYALDYDKARRLYWKGFMELVGHGSPPEITRKKKTRSRGANVQPITKTCNRREDFGA